MSRPRHRVFVARPLPGAALERLAREVDLSVWPGPLPPPPEVLSREAACSDGLLTLLTDRVDRALLEAAPRLSVVSNLAVGVDNIDVATCTARGIRVGNTPGVLTEATADLALALLLSAARHVVSGAAYVREGRWRTWEVGLFLGRELAGATLGIAGMGAIGQAVARRGHGFGLRILYASRSARPEVEQALGARRVSREELVASADFLSLHLPLGEQTRHWLGERELASMKEGSVLINTARGPIVDQRALVAALARGRPAFAALDVTDPEPPGRDDPLLSLPNVLLLPHLGSATMATRSKMAELAVDNLLAGLEGRALPYCVNPEASRR